MAISRNDYVASAGQREFDLTFPYSARAHVFVSVDLTDRPFAWISGSRVQLVTPTTVGQRVRVYRRTDIDSARVNFAAGGILTERDLNNSQEQTLFRLQESEDLIDGLDFEGAAEAGAIAGAAASAGRLLLDGMNASPTILDNLPHRAPSANAVERSVGEVLAETAVSVKGFDDTTAGGASFVFAQGAAGDPKVSRPILVPEGSYDFAFQPAGGYTYKFQGPVDLVYGFAADANGRQSLPATKIIAESGMNRVDRNGAGEIIGETYPFDTFYIGPAPVSLNGGRPEVEFERVFRESSPQGEADMTGRRSVSLAAFATVASNGNAAIFGGSRTSEGPINNGGCMGGFFTALNDQNVAGSNSGAWGVYVDATRFPGGGTTFGAELDLINKGGFLPENRLNPFNMFANGKPVLANIWSAVGGFVASADVVACHIGMISNVHPDNPRRRLADKGIIVHSEALTDQGDGYGEVLAMPKSYFAQYIDAGIGGQQVASLHFGVSDYLKGCRVYIDDRGVVGQSVTDGKGWFRFAGDQARFGTGASPWFVSEAGQCILGPPGSPWIYAAPTGVNVPVDFQAGKNGSFIAVGYADGVNGITITGGTPSNPARLAARGTDESVDLELRSQGPLGRIRFGTHEASTDAPTTGYVTIRDEAGNLRKLATIT